MDRKIVMLLIGIVAIGMFALPSTLAMYSGQHDFVTGANVDCGTCHAAGTDPIYAEIAGGPHDGWATCADCHAFTTHTSAPGPTVNTGANGHAATTLATCTSCHDTYNTDGDGVTVTNELANGAHAGFYAAAPNGDPDDACIACHTTATVVTGAINAAASSEPAYNLNNYNY
ncbi:MAG: hypothetical protein KAH86_00410 [Methanosarcinales archaeon]|nr:hypothetical protein [Methanosarcinales archaeon]